MLGIGICSWFSYHLPIEDKFKLSKEAKFDATCLWWGADDRQIQPDMARKIGLQIDNIHAPFDNANALWQEGVDGEDYQNILISCVKDCAIHEVPAVVIHLTGLPPYPPITEMGFKRIEKIIDVAKRENIKLAFENLWALKHLDAVFERFPSPCVGLCYDSGHENLNRPHDILASYGDRLFALHINDNFNDALLPDGATNWNSDAHVPPFDGTVDWNEKMQKLKKCRNVDYFTFEVDFNRNHEKCVIYKDLSAREYLHLVYEKAVKLLDMYIQP
jgi:sugar phosphate isomerase/epimerase